MATKIESEYPLSPNNDESDGENGEDPVDNSYGEESEEEERKPVNNDFESLLKKLQSAGALLKKPKVDQEYRCYTCEEDFDDWDELENHLIQHVSLPSVVVDKLPSDGEDTGASGDENWSDEEAPQPPPKHDAKKTPQKVDISQILKKTGLSIKKTADQNKSSDAALNKLSGLGFTIKKNSTPIKKEKIDESEQQNDSDVMKKLGKLGGIKLKLKSDGKKGNTFKVINGLKDFKASDDEDDASDNEGSRNNDDSGEDKNHEEDDGDQESDEEQVVNNSRRSSENSESSKSNKNAHEKLLLGRKIKNEPVKGTKRVGPASRTSGRLASTKAHVQMSANETQAQAMPKEAPKEAKIEPPHAKTCRPSVKKTPKRGANNPPVKTQEPQPPPPKASSPEIERKHKTPERRESHDVTPDKIVIKKELQEPANTESQSLNAPLFSSHIKSERSSPVPTDRAPTPIIAKIKMEPEASFGSTQPDFSSSNAAKTVSTPLLPVTKTEDTSVTIIEINGDSNDEDDDCCVVSSTPAPDVKPIVPKTEKPTLPSPYPSTMSSSYPTSVQSSYTVPPSRLSSTPSTEKQHNFNWNAPDSKPAIDVLEKSADEIFESLLSSSTKKENMSMLSEASEYVSIDALGPQHSCEVCNTRFTDISMLEEHRRITGHSSTIVAVAPHSSTLLPYNPSSNILSSLLPVKQLAEQVGKLSSIGSSSSGFTHQQNVMINIQAYPGAGGSMVPPQSYNSYPQAHNSQSGYPQNPNHMYPPSEPTMPNQYPGANYNQAGYGQYPSPMSKASYPGAVPPNIYSNASSPYSTASPLQSMQQAVYGQTATGLHNQQPMPMGPPGSSPSQAYASAPSPGSMKQSSSGIRIQNVQTFPPGQMTGAHGQPLNPNQALGPGHPMGPGPHGPDMVAGQTVPGQMPAPTQIRMAAGANVSGPRPRMPNIRGARPSIRPGIQVHGQVRGGAKPGPRMPLKRPGNTVGSGPAQKRRPDMLLPGKHDNEDCQVMAMQKQRDGLPMIQSVQGAKDKLNIGNQISITKKTVNKEASAMANVLASRGISVKQKQKSRSPTPPRPLPNIPNLGAGVSIKHSSRSSNFSIPEAKIGGGMLSCKICKKMFMNSTSLSVHMSNAHPQSKIPLFKCDECPASYPKSLQLQHHKRVFHNVTGPNRELGLPVVDLSQEDNLKRLSSLGIYSFIPLANREQANGCFGIPVISVHNVQNGMTTSLQALGADGLLSLGPLKPLPNS